MQRQLSETFTRESITLLTSQILATEVQNPVQQVFPLVNLDASTTEKEKLQQIISTLEYTRPQFQKSATNRELHRPIQMMIGVNIQTNYLTNIQFGTILCYTNWCFQRVREELDSLKFPQLVGAKFGYLVKTVILVQFKSSIHLTIGSDQLQDTHKTLPVSSQELRTYQNQFT